MKTGYDIAWAIDRLIEAHIDRAAEQARLAEMGGGWTTPAASRDAIRDAMSALADEIDVAMAEKVTQ